MLTVTKKDLFYGDTKLETPIQTDIPELIYSETHNLLIMIYNSKAYGYMDKKIFEITFKQRGKRFVTKEFKGLVCSSSEKGVDFY